jgi:hypothetical protein
MSASPEAAMTRLRRLLDRRVTVGGLAELVIWLAAGYLAVGLGWSLFHPDGVQRVQLQLERQLQLPPGANFQMAALGEASILWPVISVLPSLGCAQ